MFSFLFWSVFIFVDFAGAGGENESSLFMDLLFLFLSTAQDVTEESATHGIESNCGKHKVITVQ